MWSATLALLAACQSPARPSEPIAASASAAQPATAQPSAAVQTTPPTAPPSAPTAVAVEPNRDPHGNKDVAAYIAALEAEKRVAEMRPDFVVEQLNLPSDAVIADLGCGPGVFALRFAKACPHGVVYAVDVEPRQLDRLSEHLLAENVANVVPVLASFTTPHLPPGRCDYVFLGDTYHHLNDRVAYMKRLRAAFAPGGKLAIFEYKPGQLPVGPPPEHKLEPGVLQSELQAAGYELVTDFQSHEFHDFQLWKPVPVK
jgi:SAM-dependent methyltransferase